LFLPTFRTIVLPGGTNKCLVRPRKNLPLCWSFYYAFFTMF
jgi:hypothetical protein